jgi:hypothetical protein
MMPAELQRALPGRLPGRPHIIAVPRDSDEKCCAVWAADHYEITAFYTDMGASLTELHSAIVALPEVYQAVIFTGGRFPETWPIRYRSTGDFRPQVRALYRPEGWGK